jgi:hypothetical protein
VKQLSSKGLKMRFRPGWLIIPAAALVTFGLTEWLASHPHMVERFYSNWLYPLIARSLSPVTNLFSFSVGDIFYIAIIFSVLTLVMLTIFRRISPGKLALLLFNLVALVYLLFYWLWGFNYFRQPFNERLEISKSVADTGQYMDVFESIIEQANKYQISSNQEYSVQVLDSTIEAAYERYAGFLKIGYPWGVRKPKHITFSGFFAKAGISGYYGPFSNEVHFNRHVHPLELPVIIAHEKAHQFGITSEAEASFYAWFVCGHSDSDFLRYSASLYILRYFLNHGRKLEGFDNRVKTISQPVRDDLIGIRNHWMALRNEKIDRVASKANDAYLRTNKVEAGIEDYKGVVALVMDFSTDSLAQKRVVF